MTTNYYQKHEEKLRNEACERYQNLSEEEKKKCWYHCEQNNLFEEQNQKEVEYMRNCLAHKE